MGLVFDTAPAARPSPPQRADVACFVGFVARRPGVPLPAAVRRQLESAGWARGPQALPEPRLQALLDVPVVLDGWQLFDHLFAWDERPVAAGSPARCATWLGAALRSFFARGGQRAVLVRVGDPWPALEATEQRETERLSRLRALIPAFDRTAPNADRFTPLEPATWHGLHHLHGLREPSFLLLPDLAEACASAPPPPEGARPPLPPPEGFVECSAQEPPLPADDGLRRLPAPRLDEAGYARWLAAVQAVQAFLRQPQHRREALLLAALPLPAATLRQAGDEQRLGAYLEGLGLWRGHGAPGQDDSDRSFVQLAWPWLRTRASADLPEGLEPPCGALAGLLAAGALGRGTHRSVAGDFSLPRLADVWGGEPVPAWGGGEDAPAEQLARHVCTFAPQPGGWALQSDVTLAPREAWRFGGANRLMNSIVRNARAVGDSVAFGVNGPALWAQLQRTLEGLLMGYWHEGAFGGASASDGFEVRCDRSTMSQADLDNGRLITRISVRPAASIERITVTLNFGSTPLAAELRSAA